MANDHLKKLVVLFSRDETEALQAAREIVVRVGAQDQLDPFERLYWRKALHHLNSALTKIEDRTARS